jgi:hypothetical protein
MAEDWHVVGGIGEDKAWLLFTKKGSIAPGVPRIAAKEEMLA